MYLKINDKQVKKEDLIKLISKNKLQAVSYIVQQVNIGLKDAYNIVENLEDNPTYYDNKVLDIAERDSRSEETIVIEEKQILNKDLIEFTGQNKLEIIEQIREALNVDLKTAKKITEQLGENIDDEGRFVVDITKETVIDKEFSLGNVKNRDDKNDNKPKRKVASHIIKTNDNTKKWVYLIVLVTIAIIFYFLMTN